MQLYQHIAQKDTKLLQWKSDGKFSAFTSSYIKTALNQSAFRIHKCYIIIDHDKYRFQAGTLAQYTVYLAPQFLNCNGKCLSNMNRRSNNICCK